MHAVLAGVAVLVAGLVLAFGLKRYSVGDSVTFLALMLLPLLTYGVASGMVQEFSAPGGWGAKFREIADTRVQPAQAAKLPFEGDMVAKGGRDYLNEITSRLTPGKPLALTLQLGRAGYYNPDVIGDYIRVMSAADPGMSVMVIDRDGRYVASTRGSVVLQQLPSPDFARQFIGAIEGDDAASIAGLPGFQDQAVSDSASNVEALTRMDTIDVSRLVAVDAERRPEGFVPRDQIVSRLLIGLASTQR
jgi:hypothetical protein